MTSRSSPLPPDDASPDREPTPLELAALQWIVRCERGLTSNEERAFAAWLDADPRHRELCAEFGGTWLVMRQGAVLPAAVAATPREAEPPRARRRGVLLRFGLPLAAAAALVIGYVQWHRSEPRGGEPVVTEVGASRQVELPDGSVVRMNTDTVIVTDFTPAERRVRLQRGEAFFAVAKNPARPFIVEAAGVAVRAVGTAFNVRLRPDDVDVLVTEGKVRVAGADAAGDMASLPLAEVAANERAIVPFAVLGSPTVAPQPVTPVAPVQVARLLAWQGGRLNFFDTPLGEMVAEFNRYNRQKLAIVDPQLAVQRFGGTFRPDDHAGFVRALRENFGVRAEERGNMTLLHASR